MQFHVCNNTRKLWVTNYQEKKAYFESNVLEIIPAKIWSHNLEKIAQKNLFISDKSRYSFAICWTRQALKNNRNVYPILDHHIVVYWRNDWIVYKTNNESLFFQRVISREDLLKQAEKLMDELGTSTSRALLEIQYENEVGCINNVIFIHLDLSIRLERCHDIIETVDNV